MSGATLFGLSWNLIFAPVCDKESEEAESRLKVLFPKMTVLREDNFTLFTDSKPQEIKAYTRELNKFYTELYFKFFKLFRGRNQQGQNFVVLFDDGKDFYKYAYASTGDYRMVGFFMPTDRTLYIYNIWGGQLEKAYYDRVSKLCQEFENAAARDKESIKDSGADIVIDGYYKEMGDVAWNWYSLHKNLAADYTTEVMRHEFTHEVFHNWGLQSIITAKVDIDKTEVAKKEKEIMDALESQDKDKMEETFKELFKLTKEYRESLRVTVSNSWLAEGLAQYCETVPIGSVNAQCLSSFQEMRKKDAANPVEFLTNFATGSFAGLDYKGMLDNYAESWAFASFLMERYEEQFIKYQALRADRIAKGEPDLKGADDFSLLLNCIRKSAPELEKEFAEYMAAFKKIDDPFVAKVMAYEKIVEDFRNVERQERTVFVFRRQP